MKDFAKWNIMHELSIKHHVNVGSYNIIDPTEKTTMVHIELIEDGKTVETIIDGTVAPLRTGLSFDAEDHGEIEQMLSDGDPDELWMQLKKLFERYRNKTLYSSSIAKIAEIEKIVESRFDDFRCTHDMMEYARLKKANEKHAADMDKNIKMMDTIESTARDYYGDDIAKIVTGETT